MSVLGAVRSLIATLCRIFRVCTVLRCCPGAVCVFAPDRNRKA